MLVASITFSFRQSWLDNFNIMISSTISDMAHMNDCFLSNEFCIPADIDINAVRHLSVFFKLHQPHSTILNRTTFGIFKMVHLTRLVGWFDYLKLVIGWQITSKNTLKKPDRLHLYFLIYSAITKQSSLYKILRSIYKVKT